MASRSRSSPRRHTLIDLGNVNLHPLSDYAVAVLIVSSRSASQIPCFVWPRVSCSILLLRPCKSQPSSPRPHCEKHCLLLVLLRNFLAYTDFLNFVVWLGCFLRCDFLCCLDRALSFCILLHISLLRTVVNFDVIRQRFGIDHIPVSAGRTISLLVVIVVWPDEVMVLPLCGLRAGAARSTHAHHCFLPSDLLVNLV